MGAMKQTALFFAGVLLFCLPASAANKQTPPLKAGITGEAAWQAYDELSRKWDALGAIRYEMKITTSYQPGPNTANPQNVPPTVINFNVWEKGLYLRQEGSDESGGRYLTILHPDARFVYDFQKNRFVRQKRPVAIHRSAFNINEGSRYLTLVGKDSLDGHMVTVFEDKAVNGNTEAPAPIKVWVRDDVGLAAKEELTIPLPGSDGAALVAVTERRNIKRQAIPDNTFEVPANQVSEESTKESAAEKQG